jgi:hypothetical protein
MSLVFDPSDFILEIEKELPLTVEEKADKKGSVNRAHGR